MSSSSPRVLTTICRAPGRRPARGNSRSPDSRAYGQATLAYCIVLLKPAALAYLTSLLSGLIGRPQDGEVAKVVRVERRVRGIEA